jgi:hypothetical protein
MTRFIEKLYCHLCLKAGAFTLWKRERFSIIVLSELGILLLYGIFVLIRSFTVVPVPPVTYTGVLTSFTVNDFTYRFAFSDSIDLLEIIFIIFYSLRILELIFTGIRKICTNGKQKRKGAG